VAGSTWYDDILQLLILLQCDKSSAVDLVDFEKSDKQFDLLLCNTINDLAIVAYQLGNHLGYVQPNVALKQASPTAALWAKRQVQQS